MVNSEAPAGFIENSSEPDDQQAWCDACEALYVSEESMPERLRTVNDFAVVCVGCYDRLKQLHSGARRN
jgi:hypothetical protein